MPDPAALIAVARSLMDDAFSPPSNEQLRRAVSTAYYAIFHSILRAAATRFMGPSQEGRAGYALIYRSFEHNHMKQVCEDLTQSTLNKVRQRQLRRISVSQDMRDFAAAFSTSQVARHLADYDPNFVFERSDVKTGIEAVEAAMAAFDRTAPDEQADILALMMVRTRG